MEFIQQIVAPSTDGDGNFRSLRLKAEGVDRVISALHAAGDMRLVPIWRAIKRGAGLIEVKDPSPLPDIPSTKRQQPLIVLVHDDLSQSHGPAAYDSRALRWCFQRAGAVMIASPVVSVDWYQQIADAAIESGVALIIDTLPDHELAWAAFAAQMAPRSRPFLAGDVDGPLVRMMRELQADGVPITIQRAAAKAESLQ